MADTAAISSSQTTFSQSDLPELLQQYYKWLFPYKLYHQWLSYGDVPKTYFPNREFSFTLKDDVYLRYQSFASQEEMEKEIQKRNPHKIDIGAVFSHKPKDHKMVKAASFQALEKELVFDIDMTDYDEIRTCCKGAEICLKCWKFMVIAIKVLDLALKEDFGFKHRLWVYSGRRGVHCWVCDETARKLSQSGRSAVAEYLTIIKGGENQAKKVNIREPYHPFIKRSLSLVKKYFNDIVLDGQEILSSKETWDPLLALLNKSWSSCKKSSSERWEELTVMCTSFFQKMQSMEVIDEIMLQYTYPRLDVNVTKGLNHLLKSPFCIHPKTGRVCVPIEVATADLFDPFAVPTISQLLNQIDEYDKKHPNDNSDEDIAGKRKIRAFQKTSLMAGLSVFHKFLKLLDEENNKRRKIIKDDE
ncbi:predicted protein, partial [Nematostella vectensis]